MPYYIDNYYGVKKFSGGSFNPRIQKFIAKYLRFSKVANEFINDFGRYISNTAKSPIRLAKGEFGKMLEKGRQEAQEEFDNMSQMERERFAASLGMAYNLFDKKNADRAIDSIFQAALYQKMMNKASDAFLLISGAVILFLSIRKAYQHFKSEPITAYAADIIACIDDLNDAKDDGDWLLAAESVVDMYDILTNIESFMIKLNDISPDTEAYIELTQMVQDALSKFESAIAVSKKIVNNKSRNPLDGIIEASKYKKVLDNFEKRNGNLILEIVDTLNETHEQVNYMSVEASDLKKALAGHLKNYWGLG